MPAIRDTSFAYETVTTDGGVTIPMCGYALGDLLFAFVTGDTGAPTWGCSNGVGTWNQLFTRNNTCSTVVYWKYAAASGEGDVVVTSTVSETYSGILVSVRDVYQSYTGGSPPVQSNTTSTGTRIALPTITTTAADSLVLALVSGAGTSSFAFIEEALQDLTKVDGSAEGLAVGWFYKAAAGLTTAHNATSLSSQAGTKAVIEVRAPAGGATARPTYPVSDASILLTPTPGIAWDTNTVIAATADTSFGTSLAGKTANDATVTAAIADVGIDTGAFMSFAGLTNAATANQVSGAEAIVAAARYNIGTRNVLGHFRHPTPVNNQRLAPLASGRGIWFGLRSGATNATNYKIWQVHAADIPLVPGYVQPFLINPANTDTIASAGTVSTSDVRNYGYWTSGLGVLTQQSCFGPMWAMDTTVLAGGIAAEPIDIPGIVEAAAKRKVRFSSLLQGADQMLCFQAIQFGDGGSNPTYLFLDSTAVEFPSKKNVARKLVNYNGTDDSVGFTYYGVSGDTIRHINSVISSASKYHWRIHASSTSAATWDFAGLSIIGAGDVQLRAVTTFTGMAFTTCPTITQNSAVINDCSFSGSKIISATLGDMDNITNCAFTSSGTGHAIEVSGTASTITLTGNTFSGYAASDGSTGNEAIYVNIASGTVTLNISGGTTPSIRTAGATVVVVAGAVTVTAQAVTESGTAIASARVHVEATSGGPFPAGASVTIANSGTTATVTHTAHGMATNDKVVIRGASLDANNGVFTITSTGANSYTYTTGSAPGSNPTGSITSTFVVLNGLTDGGGQISMTRVFASNQPVTGQIRKSSGTPFYKNAAVTGTVNSSTGGTFTGVMISDD